MSNPLDAYNNLNTSREEFFKQFGEDCHDDGGDIILWDEPWERIKTNNECWDTVKGHRWMELESLSDSKEYRANGYLLVPVLSDDWAYYLIPEELEVKS